MPGSSRGSVSLTQTARITLERTQVFSGLPTEVLAALRLAMATCDVPADTYLYREGDTDDSMYIIRSGLVAIVKGQGASHIEFATRGPGEIVGETRLVDNAPRFSAAVCKTDCRLFVLSRDEFFKVIAAYPQVAQHMMAVLTARIREADLHRLKEFHRRTDELQQIVTDHERLAIKGEMAAEVAHDLHNFLCAFDAYVDLTAEAARKGQTADLERCLQGMRQAYEQIRLFADSLLYSRYPSGQRAVIHLNEFLLEQIAFLKHQRRFKHLTFQSNLDPLLPPILCDPAGLQQAIYSLVANASEAMRAGTTEAPTVALRTCSQPAAASILLTVTDNGPGIPEALIPHLFRQRVSDKKTEHGFGLVNVVRIVADHGGTISASNRPEGGAEFTISLPLGGPDQADHNETDNTACISEPTPERSC